MWKVPKKYHTFCKTKNTGELIQELDIEAINVDEAKTRAFLNCINLTSDDEENKSSIFVEVEKS